MLRPLSLLFVCILLLSCIGEAFHHHCDSADHPECAVCMAVLHHKAHAGSTFVPKEIRKELVGALNSLPILIITGRTVCSLSLGRAPPA